MRRRCTTISRVAFTVDVEQDAPPYFASWRGLEEGMSLLLALLDAQGIKATFFVTGEAASRFPETIAAAAGKHEIGCHGLDHTRFDRIGVEEQRRQVDEATAILQHVTGQAPAGFRAPNFQYTRDTLRIVQQAGYLYDASRALYHRGLRDACVDLLQIANTFPSSLLRLPWSLSGPLLRTSLLLLSLVVLDFHPWELVPISGVRPDIRYATGKTALRRLDSVLSHLRASGVRFTTLKEAAQALPHV
jgi:peptidoglycan/xylan/chitin deacetylase (PgdA/CDA1 family)